MADIQYDDRKLRDLFTELEPKRRLKALKGAFRKEANKVRRTAVNNLRGSIRSDADLEKGVRVIVFKRAAGFRVTIGTKKATKRSQKEYGFHKNRQGLKKPVLIWAEEGTEERATKGGNWVYKYSGNEKLAARHGSGYKVRRKKVYLGGQKRGRMKRYGFMRKTRDEVADRVTEELHSEVINNVIKTAKKYGCI